MFFFVSGRYCGRALGGCAWTKLLQHCKRRSGGEKWPTYEVHTWPAINQKTARTQIAWQHYYNEWRVWCFGVADGLKWANLNKINGFALETPITKNCPERLLALKLVQGLRLEPKWQWPFWYSTAPPLSLMRGIIGALWECKHLRYQQFFQGFLQNVH